MEKIFLKKIINAQNKVSMICLIAGAFMALYLASGAISAQYAQLLPMSEWEYEIPFLTWTIWIYIVLYPTFLVWCLYSLNCEMKMNKTLYGFIILTVVSCVMFIVFPITYPRWSFPLPLDNTFTNNIFRLTRLVDKPSNCLPSLHVGICYLFSFAFFDISKKKFTFAMMISTLIAISTLTTKQHYIADIVVGFILSLGIHLFIEKMVDFRIESKN